MRRLQTGEKIGDYVIHGFLGAGGMGEVYQGEHTRINRLAAIKVLSRYQNSPTFINRFFNEARVQSSLHHPNIATLYDFKEIDSQLFIFMEFADGDVLEDLNKRKFFAVEEALRTFEAICEAVSFIHKNGIIHRDIKAQNIKITSCGKVKLLDFGIAKDAASQRLTKVGGMIGTPHYLAPEQLDGQEATVQTDIWSLGVLFYGMLTGTEPFQAETFGKLHTQIYGASFDKPEKLNSAIPSEVSQIVCNCLEKYPANRYQTVDEITTDIKKVLGGEKLKQPLLSFKRKAKNKQPKYFSGAVLTETQGTAKRSPMIIVAAFSAVAVLMVFSIVGFFVWAASDESSKENNSNIAIVVPINSPKPDIADLRNSKQILPQSSADSELVKVLVDTNEGSVDIYRDDQRIGKTPLEVEGREGETVNLTLKREGFQDQRVQLLISARRKVYTFILQRK